MDLNDIRLSHNHLAELYTDSLVELASEAVPETAENNPTKPVPAAAPAPAATHYLGQHGRSVLLVNNDPAVRFIADADLEVLTKIMDRAGIGLADIAIVNWAQLPAADGSALLSELGSKRVLLFGLAPDAFGLPVVFPHHQVQQLSGRSFLCAPPVAELAVSADSVKKTFWTSFKTWLG
ncbi:MAG: hypothetical protein EOO08_10395 [Chitinophagaceae bacterium]|nr:MAG: hypothetical protein EOO08_10395 [Chitinophagaceae bacterium]